MLLQFRNSSQSAIRNSPTIRNSSETPQMIIPCKIQEAVQKIGARRVIWGTDGPHKNPDTGGFAHTELDKVLALDLGLSDEAAVLGGAIAALLKV